MTFPTLQSAEEYFWATIASHNEDEAHLERWLSEQVILDVDAPTPSQGER